MNRFFLNTLLLSTLIFVGCSSKKVIQSHVTEPPVHQPEHQIDMSFERLKNYANAKKYKTQNFKNGLSSASRKLTDKPFEPKLSIQLFQKASTFHKQVALSCSQCNYKVPKNRKCAQGFKLEEDTCRQTTFTEILKNSCAKELSEFYAHFYNKKFPEQDIRALKAIASYSEKPNRRPIFLTASTKNSRVRLRSELRKCDGRSGLGYRIDFFQK